VVCGVSGSGKSTLGAALAGVLGLPFVDADALHPEANLAKMAAGVPLVDEDRWPWLENVGDVMASTAPGVVVACSALRRRYRDVIRSRVDAPRFVLLEAPSLILRERMETRPGHFMPASLLDSQLATLEPLGSDEHGLRVDASHSVHGLTAQISGWLASPVVM
jgi:gluconokinase